ncbi:MAG TPA: choice-of-anchor tandem repeat GloVer-containing protein [Candidatus Sulfotelmatobacter sp.]|jgi:uncharacterized repeat protein (TIGR03803 family)
MRFRKTFLGTALIVATLALTALANAATESLLYTFTETTSFWPQGALLEDASGNFYGTTRGGGAYGVGTVFEFSPPTVSGGSWTLTTLYSFQPYGSGGYMPISDLVRDQKGNFYGVFYSGGDPSCNCGGVFKLIAPTVSGGAWTETAIYSFKEVGDGHFPAAFALSLQTNGSLYGTTIRGGTYDSGTLYQLTTKNGTTYTETVLYSFGEVGDANTPNGPIAVDAKGYLYGVASFGGAFNQGAVFKYVPASLSHVAVESLLYSFGGTESTGTDPIGNVIFDAGGNLYGVTNTGGSANDYGVVYSLAPGNPTWNETILYTFVKSSGVNPVAGLAWNHKNNNLYGTTSSLNGLNSGDGSVFKLVPPTVKGGAWTETTEFEFTYAVSGGYPTGVVALDTKTGYLYGSAMNGGVVGCDLYCGTIWQITNP